MTPENLVAEVSSDALSKIPFDMLSLTLSNLDVDKQTAAMVLLLSAMAKITEKTKDVVKIITFQDEWSNRVTALLGQLDTRQIPLVLDDLKLVTQVYTDVMVKKKAIAGIKPLRTLIKRYTPGPTFITPQHASFVQLCLVAEAYTAALPIISEHPFELDVEKTGVDGKDVRLYLYYAGMAWIGLGRWEEAIEVLRACVQVPAQGCSAIVLEAYKKFILASLIHTGTSETLSKGFIPSIQRHSKSYALYDELASVFSSNSLKALHKHILQNKDALVKDRNFGLAKQLFEGLQRRIVVSLTKTFLTLSLSDIASRIKLDTPQEAEAFIVACIKRGEIKASISQKDGMVSFQGSTHADPNLTRSELDDRLKQFIKLAHTIEEADYAMATDPKYMEKVLAADKSSGNTRAGVSMDDDAAMLMRS